MLEHEAWSRSKQIRKIVNLFKFYSFLYICIFPLATPTAIEKVVVVFSTDSHLLSSGRNEQEPSCEFHSQGCLSGAYGNESVEYSLHGCSLECARESCTFFSRPAHARDDAPAPCWRTISGKPYGDCSQSVYKLLTSAPTRFQNSTPVAIRRASRSAHRQLLQTGGLTLTAGECALYNNDGCFRSPNYDAATGALYGASQSCSITVNYKGYLDVHAFSTEATYDTLTVGGVAYSGTTGPSLVAVAKSSTITWSSDRINFGTGFEICLIITETSSPTTAPTVPPTISPTTTPTTSAPSATPTSAAPSYTPTTYAPSVHCCDQSGASSHFPALPPLQNLAHLPRSPSFPGPGGLTLTAGECALYNNDGCFRSPNYDAATGALYGASQSCSITVNYKGYLDVHAFSTEATYDTLTVGGVAYSGTTGPSLVAAAKSSTITWFSDRINFGTGFEICLIITETSSPTTAPTVPPTISPTTTPTTSAPSATPTSAAPSYTPTTYAPSVHCCDQSGGLTLTAGECALYNNDGCFRSPNYDAATGALYGASQSCSITVNYKGYLDVHAFSTEATYDTLTVGGVAYSGTTGPSLVAAAKSSTITWSSDRINFGTGFEICLIITETSSPTAAPTITPTASPSSSPTTSFPSTVSPTFTPTASPTVIPTSQPTAPPTTLHPTSQSPTTSSPTSLSPTTSHPTSLPPTTDSPTTTPTTSAPSLTPTTLTPSLTPTTYAPSVYCCSQSGGLTLTAGECALYNNDGCFRSPNYDAATGALYGASQSCSITVNYKGYLDVHAFSTEATYDTLTVGGVAYSGTTGPSLVAVAKSSTITWSSDRINFGTGFEICLIITETSSPTTSPTLPPTAAPTITPTTVYPTTTPTANPTSNPSTGLPTAAPTLPPTSSQPTSHPSRSPTTTPPTSGPTTMSPSTSPTTLVPSLTPTTYAPSEHCCDQSGGLTLTTGECALYNNDGCFRSPHYDAATGALYGASQSCSITVNYKGYLDVHAFSTEATYDTLTVGGVAYSGTTGPSLVAAAKSSTITWSSDRINFGTGFEICLIITETSSPTTATPTTMPTSAPSTRAPSEAPTASPTFSPTSLAPTAAPTSPPTTLSPSVAPTASPASAAPTAGPSWSPTAMPSVIVICPNSIAYGRSTASSAYTAGPDYLRAVDLSFSAGDILTAIEFYCSIASSAAGPFQLGLYSDSSDAPGTLLVSVTHSSAACTAGWNTATLDQVYEVLTTGTLWVASLNGGSWDTSLGTGAGNQDNHGYASYSATSSLPSSAPAMTTYTG
ncbi:hypothetical protein CYMTET_32750, partial [Cymbomonas tetramitiformis]